MAAEAPKRGGVIASINMTPLVDIMLVLLIIFMIATQAADSAAVPVQLPKASSAATAAPTAVVVALDRRGVLRIDGRLTDRVGLRQFLEGAVRRDRDLQVVIAADERLPYADVVAALDVVRTSGVSRYALKVRTGAGARPGA